MKKQPQPQSIEQYVIPPDGGIVTRFPSNQTWRKNYSGLSVASNVRAAAGRLYNAPGYENAPFYPAIVAPPLLIADVELVQGTYHVLGDASNLYAVTEDLVPSVYPGLGGTVAGLSFTFADAVATGYLGAALGVTWSQVSGPGTSTFSDPGAINATVTVTLPGLYTFQLSGSDGITTVTASVSVRFITCTASPTPYTFPSSAGGVLALVGAILGVTDPSDPRSDSSSYLWSQVSGPAAAAFSDPTLLSPSVTAPGTPGAYVLELTVSVGDTSYSAQVTLTVPVLAAFDFAILRYSWTDDEGRDLDTRTAFEGSGTGYDDVYVGWDCQYSGDYGFAEQPVQGPSGGSGQGELTISDPDGNLLMQWGGDNTTVVGNEAVLINFKQFALDYPDLATITCRLRAYWYGLRLSGNLQIQFQTYLGGTMEQYVTEEGQYDWNNVGGVLVDDITVERNSATFAQSGDGPNGAPLGDDMGTLVYNPTTKAAVINPP